MIFVTVNGERRAVEAGTRLSALFVSDLPCGGHGKCGKCKVRAYGELSPLSDTERERLTQEEIASGIRLACCTEAVGDCFVESISDAKKDTILTDGGAILSELHPAFESLGAAIDIGTTTLAAKLYSRDGITLAECGRSNPQSAFGADVISRIESSIGGNAEALAQTIVRALDAMLCELAAAANRNPREIDGIVITGNTAMLYLLTKTSPEPLSHAPFTMSRGFGEALSADILGLTAVSPDASVYLPPCISAFVGADTVCALLASGACDADETALMADIGTNGEIALRHDGALTVCSTAAGPAFEGVGISMGMRGADGAIDRVTLLNGKLHAHVIGDIAPVGICGSGLIDAVACLLEDETIDETGFLEDDETEIMEPVTLTRKDIRMVQLAKSAICAGIQTLLHSAGIKDRQVEAFYIAGGFGSYLNKLSAARIGLLPVGLISKVQSIGNAALGGAAMLLLDSELREQSAMIAKSAVTVELSTDPFFSEAYMSGMLFPEGF